jgi:microcystin-dependent protein
MSCGIGSAANCAIYRIRRIQMTRKICRYFITVCLLLGLGIPATAALAEDTPFIGEMIWVPFNFAPTGWHFCDGTLILISQNTALFSLLGTTYGGDGKSTFALPDMQGRVMINAGQGSGLSDYVQGETGGEVTHTLVPNEMPAHNHGVRTSTAAGTFTTPVNTMYGQSGSMKLYGTNPTANMSANALGIAGSGQPHNNMMPYGTLNCIIALQGIFPARP